jgi:hypothetical protein
MSDQPQTILFRQPGRYLITGKAGSGKTTVTVDVIVRKYCKKKPNGKRVVDRVIVICPTYDTQSAFDPLREFVDSERDVFTELRPSTISQIVEQIKEQHRVAHERGVDPPNNLILIDDFAGNRTLHMGRKGDFADFVLQSRHYNTSLFVISQQPKAITPAFRDNLEGVIVFPSLRRADYDWVHEEYGGAMRSKEEFMKVVRRAWRGPNGKEEFGQHFLFILLEPRTPARFFTDFTHELSSRKPKLTWN